MVELIVGFGREVSEFLKEYEKTCILTGDRMRDWIQAMLDHPKQPARIQYNGRISQLVILPHPARSSRGYRKAYEDVELRAIRHAKEKIDRLIIAHVRNSDVPFS